MLRFGTSIGLLLSICMSVYTVYAQGINLTNMPIWEANDRFETPVLTGIKHPALSFNGFDNGGNHSKGYGFRQVVENYYSQSPSLSIESVFDDLSGWAADSSTFDVNPTSRAVVTRNGTRLQARAFVALTTYILDKHGIDPTTKGLPSHALAIQRLRNALLTFSGWEIDDTLGGESDDAVKWTNHLMGIARAMDLYLALENAYCFYGDQGDTAAALECTSTTSTSLLSFTDKRNVFQHYWAQIQKTSALSKEDAIVNVSRLRFEIGNFALKIKAALGYAVTVHQSDPFLYTPQYSLSSTFYAEALDATLSLSPNDRERYHYGFQTGGGKRFFGEGSYYLQFALRELIGFWHSNRILGGTDPFNSTLHLRLADVVTPEGATPPLDDGNRKDMENAPLMRWSSVYGNAAIGQKFAWISDNGGNGFGSSENVLLLELAIPRLEIGQGITPASDIVNVAGGLVTGEDAEQQLVIRRGTTSTACTSVSAPGECHYLLLNGESGRSYSGGEGHEQADQLQLLYYIDGLSLLIDSGYDRGGGATSHSSWIHYSEHNVISSTAEEGGGLTPPELNVFLPGKEIDISPPDYIYHDGNGSVDVLSGSQPLPDFSLPSGTFPPIPIVVGGTYKRDALYIQGSTPYLIDLSRAYYNSPPILASGIFRLSYHTSNEDLSLQTYNEPGDSDFITSQNIGGTNTWLYMHPVSIEYPVKVSDGDITYVSDDAEEFFRSKKPIRRLDIKDNNFLRNHFSVATLLIPRDNVAGPQPNPPKLIWPSYPQDTHQGWVQQQDANTYDVFVARSINQALTPTDVIFNLRDADATFPDVLVHWPASADYGFVRVVSGATDPNYQLNLTTQPKTVTYTQSDTHTTNGAPLITGQTIQVSAGVQVTFSDLVTVMPGVNIELGDGAAIYFDAGIDAQGTQALPIRFIPTGSSAPRVEIRGGSASTLAHTQFEGPLYQGPNLYIKNNAQVTFSGTNAFNNDIQLENTAAATVAAGATHIVDKYTLLYNSATFTVGANATVEHGGNFYVYAGTELTIEEGVDYYTDGAVIANGLLEVLGTVNNAVDFRPLNGSAWHELSVRTGGVGGSRIEYANLFDTRFGVYALSTSNLSVEGLRAYGSGNFTSTMLFMSSGTSFSKSRFTGSSYGFYSYMASATTVNLPSDNQFYNNTVAGLWVDDNSALDFGSTGVPALVSVHGNGDGIIAEGNASVRLGLSHAGPPAVVLGGTNAIYNNTGYEVVAKTGAYVFGEYTWWGQPMTLPKR